jgi:hypothetical protein
MPDIKTLRHSRLGDAAKVSLIARLRCALIVLAGRSRTLCSLPPLLESEHKVRDLPANTISAHLNRAIRETLAASPTTTCITRERAAPARTRLRLEEGIVPVCSQLLLCCARVLDALADSSCAVCGLKPCVTLAVGKMQL